MVVCVCVLLSSNLCTSACVYALVCTVYICQWERRLRGWSVSIQPEQFGSQSPPSLWILNLSKCHFEEVGWISASLHSISLSLDFSQRFSYSGRWTKGKSTGFYRLLGSALFSHWFSVIVGDFFSLSESLTRHTFSFRSVFHRLYVWIMLFFSSFVLNGLWIIDGRMISKHF